MTLQIPLWAAIIVPLCAATFGYLLCAVMVVAGDGE